MEFFPQSLIMFKTIFIRIIALRWNFIRLETKAEWTAMEQEWKTKRAKKHQEQVFHITTIRYKKLFTREITIIAFTFNV